MGRYPTRHRARPRENMQRPLRNAQQAVGATIMLRHVDQLVQHASPFTSIVKSRRGATTPLGWVAYVVPLN
jgi:hypothetical protein